MSRATFPEPIVVGATTMTPPPMTVPSYCTDDTWVCPIHWRNISNSNKTQADTNDQDDSQWGPSPVTQAPFPGPVDPSSTSSDHHGPGETKVSDAAISAFMDLPDMWPEDWVYRPEDPNAYERAVYRDLEKWSSTIEEAFPSAGYTLGRPSHMAEGLRLIPRQYPSPSSVTDGCRGVYVTEVKRDWVNDTVEAETVLLENAGKRQSEGWEVWYHPDRPCDKERNGADPRQVPKIEDILEQDKPHLDTKFFHPDSDATARGDHQSVWAPGTLGSSDPKNPASL